MSQDDKEKKNETFQDPKTAFLFELKNRVSEINRDLFDFQNIKAAYKISVTLQAIEIPNKPELKEIKRLQTEWLPEESNKSPFRTLSNSLKPAISSPEIHKINRLFNECLNSTYFKGWSGVQPRSEKEAHIGED